MLLSTPHQPPCPPLQSSLQQPSKADRRAYFVVLFGAVSQRIHRRKSNVPATPQQGPWDL